MSLRFRDLVKRVASRLPAFTYLILAKLDDRVESMMNSDKPTDEVFGRIYRNNVWGGPKGEFFSGLGTREPEAADSYIGSIRRLASSEGFVGRSFVDLGCGDFTIGMRLCQFSSEYVGIDIVSDLVSHLQTLHSSDRISFQHLDITSDPLPAVEVCFVRQVFQHLSNQQILMTLPKLKAYKWVIITEHHPSDSKFIPNLDKVQGGSIRLVRSSGVVLTEPPFSLSGNSVRLVSEWKVVPQFGRSKGRDLGVLRTFLWEP